MASSFQPPTSTETLPGGVGQGEPLWLLGFTKFAYVLRGDRRRLCAEPRRDIVCDRRNFPVVIASAERGHGERAVGRVPFRTRQYDLRDVYRSGIVHRTATGQRCTRRQRAGAGPAVTAYAGAFEDLFTVRIGICRPAPV